MKRWLKWILIACALSVLLCVTALAAGNQSGIYSAVVTEKGKQSGYTLEPVGGTKTSVTLTDGTQVEVFAGAEKLTLKSQNTGSGYKLVLAQTSEGTPTEDNLVYIDQSDEAGSAVAFTIYPKQLTSGTYYIYVSTSTGLDLIGTFSYYQAYILGDVDESGALGPNDAVCILQHLVGIKEITGTALLAADVDHSGSIGPNDAVKILQALVGITEIN